MKRKNTYSRNFMFTLFMGIINNAKENNIPRYIEQYDKNMHHNKYAQKIINLIIIQQCK